MTLQFGHDGAGAGTFQFAQTSRRPFMDVVASLRREIDAGGMKVLHEIDPQAALRGIGQETGGCRLLFFFHPALVARLLQTEWTAIAEAPLKLAVVELPDGAVSVRMADPAAAFARYGNAALAAFGAELANRCDGIVSASV